MKALEIEQSIQAPWGRCLLIVITKSFQTSNGRPNVTYVPLIICNYANDNESITSFISSVRIVLSPSFKVLYAFALPEMPAAHEEEEEVDEERGVEEQPQQEVRHHRARVRRLQEQDSSRCT